MRQGLHFGRYIFFGFDYIGECKKPRAAEPKAAEE
jgi:hypothetical protein